MKKNLFFMIIISLLLLPNIILANTYSVDITCPSVVNPGETVSCVISSTVDESIVSISGNISVDGITADSFVANSSLTCNNCSTQAFNINESSGILAKVGATANIGTLKVTIPASAAANTTYRVTVKDISALASDNTNISYKTIASTMRVRSTDSTLSNITVGKYPLVPAFKSDVYSYKVEAEDVEKILVSATSTDGHAIISGTGNISLKYGDNTIYVTSKSESGSEKKYKIIINRFDSRDKVNTLDNLVVEGYDLNKTFDPNETKYDVTVESNVKSVKISSERTNALDYNKPKSTYVKNFGNRTVSLKYGLNKVQVKVRAENEVVKTYTLNITRIDDRDPNNYLKTLEISSAKYVFKKETTNYTLNVENNVGVVSIKAEAESDKATVDSISRLDLKEGSNKLTIKVTAENETEREYNITINRLKEGISIEEVESITYFKQLKVMNKAVKFNQKETNYIIPITTENTLTFEYELFEGATGTIELKGSQMGPIKLVNGKKTVDLAPIVDGSIIYVNVVSPEGYSRTYTYTAKIADYYIGDTEIPEEKLEIKWSWQLIVGIVSLLIIIAEVGYAIYFGIKNGGVENKKDDVRRTIEGGIDDIKKIPQKNELRKEQRAAAAKLKQEEKIRKAEQKKLEAEQRKKQKEQDKIDRIENKKNEKILKEQEKAIEEEKKRIAKEAEKAEKEYIASLERAQSGKKDDQQKTQEK